MPELNKETMSQEDINLMQEALAHKGIDIKTLVADYKLFKSGQNVVTKEKKKTAKKNYSTKPDVTFELVTCDYPDFCIRKKTSKTEKLLIIMPSCEGYFIKTIKNNAKGKESEISREELNRENYAAFTSGMTSIELENFWINSIWSGVTFYDDVIRDYLGNDTVREMVKKHCAPDVLDYSDAVFAYEKVPNLYRDFHNNESILKFITENVEFIEEIQKTYSLEKARIFLNRLSESNINSSELNSESWVTQIYEKTDGHDDYDCDGSVFNRFAEKDEGYCKGSCRPNIEMDFEKMCNYIIVQSVRMGYRNAIDTFFDEWNDCLRMQYLLSEKITNKYPNSLATYHRILSCEYEDAKIEIDKKKLAKQAEYCSQFEAKVDDYVFICPKSKEDVLNEAQQQSNCLASYVEKYTNGRCMLFFMRYKDSPKESLVTIEVIGDKITQKYQAMNRSTTAEQDEVIDKWFKKKFNQKAS